MSSNRYAVFTLSDIVLYWILRYLSNQKSNDGILMKKILYIAATIITLVIGAVFSARNAAEIKLDFIIGVVETNLSLAIIIALILGAILGVLASLLWLISSKRENQKLKKQTATLNKEITNLRTIPLRDKH